MVAPPVPTPVAAVFVGEGEFIDHTPAADLIAGQVVVQGELVAVAQRAAAAGDKAALATTGLYDFPKLVGAGEGIAVGSKVFWEEANQVARTDDASGTNKYIGKTVAAAGDDDPTVRAQLAQ